MLRVVEDKGTLETAQRAMQICAQIFMYAIATGRAVRNPVPDLRGALKSPVVKHRSYLKEGELPPYLEKLEAYDGEPQTKLALRFLLLTFVRTGELRGAQWSEIDWDKAEWRIPAERMKMKVRRPARARVAVSLTRRPGICGIVWPTLHQGVFKNI